MSINLSGYHKYDPYPCKPGYVPDRSQLIDISDPGSNSTSASPNRPESGHRPSVDTYEPSHTLEDLSKLPHHKLSSNIQALPKPKNPAFTTMNPHTKPASPPSTAPLPPDKRTQYIRLVPYDPNEVSSRPTMHLFLRQTGKYLAEAAKEIANTGKVSSEYFYDVDRRSFAIDALDFFTGGNYTDKDVETLKGQLDQMVRELAEQVKAGQEMDVSKVKTKLTGGGVETTAADLFQLQKMGRIFDDECTIYCGSLISADYGATGVAYAAAKKMAASHGELGKMFGKTIDRLFEKYRENFLKETTKIIETESPKECLTKYLDALNSGQEILDAYANIDFGDPSAMAQAHSKASNIVQQHCNRFGLSFESKPIASYEAEIEKYAAWINTQVFH